MATAGKVTRHRPTAALRTTAVSASVVAALALSLTACGGDSGTTTSPATGHAATTGAGSGGGAGATAAGSKPAGSTTADASDAKPSSSSATSAPTAPPAPAEPAASSTSGCDHRMPISPDEIAVYRYTPEGGSLNLIVRYGNWGCAPADSDGAPFVTVGKETYLPMDQAAYITATNPIVESTENQHIGVQEFLDWLEAHPDSGLVFKYHLDGEGAIDRLDEVFTP
ncbi:hypothetical protein ACH4ZX_04560 [Streptomyces sp. NPDC020490]|uniref:hypothetical protein n=1 Tax=Streptomyces sp. NPDC020490 TaxID=3365078 RepID=UPI0037B22241